MTKEEHIKFHKQLHRSLDILLADFVSQIEKTLSKTPIVDLMVWSFQQTVNPTERK
jgi:hypothetical protein